jgi:hypothetical protein
MRSLFATAWVIAGVALAQFPGQTPYPRIPGRAPQTRPAPEATPQVSRTAALELRDTSGILRRLSGRELVMESTDHRIVWFRIGDDVEISAEKFHLGDRLTVSSSEDDEGNYTAISVQWESAATKEDLAVAEQDWDLPVGAVIEEKDDRPKLTRGKSVEAEAVAAATTLRERVRSGPLPSQADDAAIARAREAAEDFVDSLPSFAAKQNTTRYIQENSRAQWRALDIVTADLVYRNGSEEYTNIKLNNKASNKPLEEIDGLHSTGEFGSILGDLFDRESGSDFARPTQVDLRGRRAWKYRFEVPRERSDFRITTPSQHYYAAHGGSLWLDFETSRVLRLEMQARGLPKAFPFDTVEMTIDYEFIRLDGAKQFLLPTQSEALYCIRGTSVCRKNSTSFRNYVKFNAESDIVFEEPKE